MPKTITYTLVDASGKPHQCKTRPMTVSNRVAAAQKELELVKPYDPIREKYREYLTKSKGEFTTEDLSSSIEVELAFLKANSARTVGMLQAITDPVTIAESIMEEFNKPWDDPFWSDLQDMEELDGVVAIFRSRGKI